MPDYFSKATFKGIIEKFSKDIISTSCKTFDISRQLTFHGVTKMIDNCQATITKTEKGILMEGNFKAKASDFEIEIPSVVRN